MLEIIHFPLPERHDERVWLDYQELARTLDHELVGGPGLSVSPESAWETARRVTETRLERLIAYADGTPVGYASLRIELVDEPTSGSAYAYVLPAHRRRGIGSALAERMGEIIREAGLTKLTAWAMVHPEGERRLVPASGVGSVPADDPGIRFAVVNGFTLEQVERVSRYDFDAPLVDPMEAMTEARRADNSDYELLTFEGLAPADIVGDLAVMRERMITDPPSGGMEVVEQKWDAERLNKRDERLLVTNWFWRAVVRHVPSGQFVALSEILRDRTNPDAFLEQWDTIVLPEHRGRRLGMLVKAANLIQVHRAAPDATSILTWNAEENRYMLDVNEALGFRQVLVEAAFQRRL